MAIDGRALLGGGSPEVMSKEMPHCLKCGKALPCPCDTVPLATTTYMTGRFALGDCVAVVEAGLLVRLERRSNGAWIDCTEERRVRP